jgi:DNA mismatch repair ATPase MutS
MIITGPNAAGKTTLLKTTIFNIILSQQIGFGFYKKAKLEPYDYIHCYINIPDTSGRDSLFQAEARRCKNILDIIQNSSDNERHFCIFDELYSGTNPYEAISSANAYLKYLNKYDNLNFMLTTHYLDLCKRLDGVENIKNYHMNILTHNDHSNNNHKASSFIYTYELKEGISTIKGGIKVLSDLDYPKEIIFNTEKIINNIKL